MLYTCRYRTPVLRSTHLRTSSCAAVLGHKMRRITGDALLLPAMHTVRHSLQLHEPTVGSLPHPAHAMSIVYEQSTADILSARHCPVVAFLLPQRCMSPSPKTGVCSLWVSL